MDEHDYRYGDPKRVAEARVQAKGRIAARQLQTLLLDSWAAPLAQRILRAWHRLFGYPPLVCKSCGYRVPYLGDRWDQCARAFDHWEANHE